MTRTSQLSIVALLLSLSLPAWAGRKGKLRGDIKDAVQDARNDGLAASAAGIPALSKLLSEAGWRATPEMSGVFQPGRIYEPTREGHRIVLANCFETEPIVSTYTASEVVTQLQAGVGMDMGVAGAGVQSGLIKQVKFSTPEQHTIPRLMLQPTDACKTAIDNARSSGMNTSGWYVVQEVLQAEIAEQTCGKVSAEGRIVGLGEAEAEWAKACAQYSLEPVAVGYRVLLLQEVPGLAAPKPQTTTIASTPAPEQSPAIAPGSGPRTDGVYACTPIETQGAKPPPFAARILQGAMLKFTQGEQVFSLIANVRNQQQMKKMAQKVEAMSSTKLFRRFATDYVVSNRDSGVITISFSPNRVSQLGTAEIKLKLGQKTELEMKRTGTLPCTFIPG